MGASVLPVVLAAGESRRMGQPKALLPWKNGTVLECILETIGKAGLGPVLVVTGAHHKEIVRQTRSSDSRFCENPDWSDGMGTSIRCGLLAALEINPRLKGLMVLLADQPLVTEAYLRRLVTAFQPSRQALVATRYAEGGGVPAVFGHNYFDALRSQSRRDGAKSLLRDHASDTQLLDAGYAGRDMDTPENYRQLRKLAGLPDLSRNPGMSENHENTS